MRTGVGLFLLAATLCVAGACVDDEPSPKSSGDDAGAPDGAGDDARADGGAGDDAAQDAPGSVSDASDAGPFDANYYGGLELWLKADDGVVQGDAGGIAGWTDRSTRGRAVAPPGDTTCPTGPTLVPGALHGLPLVDFNGSTQCLAVGGDFKDFTSGLTVFAVFQPKTCNSSFLGNSGALFDSHDNTSFDYRDGVTVGRNPTPAQNASGDALLTITNGTSNVGQVGITGGGSWVPATAELLTFRLPAAAGGALVAGTAFVDSVSQTPSPNNPLVPSFTANRTTTYVGFGAGTSSGYHYYCGGIGELLVYSKALSQPDREAVEAHLKTRWAL